MTKILLVDDEPNIVELNEMYLAAEGYEIATATDGIEALTAFRIEKPDLIVLDVMMPDLDGWEVCRRIREESDVPIIMLTARGEDIDRIVGLEMGADDYMSKPFNPRELLARIRSVLRRATRQADPNAAAANNLIELGDLALDPDRHEATADGKVLQLRGKEFELLHCLLKNQGIVMSRQQLLDLVWGYDYYGETRTVDVHVAQLRKELSHSNVQIETVWGVGYKLVVS
ncbi:MAG: response regulator transcription factor [Chloroflexota bacterium]